MKTTILIIQLIVSITLCALILLQSQGTGLGSTFGGGGEFYRSRRGLEKVLFRFTIVCAALFLITSLLNFIIQ